MLHATDRVDGNYNYNAYNSGIMHNDNVRIFSMVVLMPYYRL